MTPTPQAIENAARAMRHITFSALTMDECRDAAQAALSCDLGDMVLVPKEPVGAMRGAGELAFLNFRGTASHNAAPAIYRAMIAAAEDGR